MLSSTRTRWREYGSCTRKNSSRYSKPCPPNGWFSGCSGSSSLMNTCSSLARWFAPRAPIIRPNSGQSSTAPGQRVKATDVPCTPIRPPPPLTNSTRFCRSAGSVKQLPTVLLKNTRVELPQALGPEHLRIAADHRLERAGLLAHEREGQVGRRDGAVPAVAHVQVEDEQLARLARRREGARAGMAASIRSRSLLAAGAGAARTIEGPQVSARAPVAARARKPRRVTADAEAPGVGSRE